MGIKYCVYTTHKYSLPREQLYARYSAVVYLLSQRQTTIPPSTTFGLSTHSEILLYKPDQWSGLAVEKAELYEFRSRQGPRVAYLGKCPVSKRLCPTLDTCNASLGWS